MEILVLTAVKSDPKNPCSTPDHIVRGIMRTWYGFFKCWKVATSRDRPDLPDPEPSLSSSPYLVIQI